MASRNRSSKSKKKSRKKSGRKSKNRRSWKLRLFLYATTLFIAVSAIYVLYLDFHIRSQFEGKRWELPARVYARPLELYPEKTITHAEILRELRSLNYQKTDNPQEPGTYTTWGDVFVLVTRPFVFWDGSESSRRIRLSLANNRVDTLIDTKTRQNISLARLDAAKIASIYPAHNEDRVLVQLQQVPDLLVKGLMAVEDRHFYNHYGLDFKAIARALLANIKAGKTVQGGSTLTQQLVKNYFLTNTRSLWRKLNEAIMAPLLEWHYEKDEILEAYLNEVYLAQDGRRAIHGFGLASQFYFRQPLHKLKTHQIALLIGLVKGPSYYDPRRHPERATKRRNLVLDLMLERKAITKWQASNAKRKGLDVSGKVPGGITAYPAFIDLVRRQLRRDYRDEDLTSEGLQIFTTLDPVIQHYAEKGMSRSIKSLETGYKLKPGKLQGAFIVTSTEQGEVVAVVGDRNPRFAGFNRALDAVRQVGSLIKPAVYLAALSKPDQYTLASLIDDSPIHIESDNGETWSPQNYDHEFHGDVPLYLALANSYNISTTRLGMEVGLDDVVSTLKKMGIERPIPAYPSLLLGAVSMSPLEVTQIYQTLASGGFKTPLRSIRAVMNAQGEPLSRYPLTVEKVVSSEAAFLVNIGMQQAVQQGTGKSLSVFLPDSFGIAGKTGTTDDLRDSWFAGFSGNYLGVAWLGMDDNQTTRLSGSSGALQVWGDVLRQINPQPLQLLPSENIEFTWIDPRSGLKSAPECAGAVQLPFIKGSVPAEDAECKSGGIQWLKDIFR